MDLNLTADAARDYAVAVLRAAGFPDDDAALCADAVVESSLRGIDSHGLTTLLPVYARQARAGEIDFAARPELVAGCGAVATLDGGGAAGPRTARAALDEALGRARSAGIGAVALRRSGYLGALWWCVAPAAEQGLIGLCAANSEACVAPFGGREPLHGTNALAVAVPHEPFPIAIDMRTNELRMADYWDALRHGKPLPGGALLASDGSPTDDPAAVDGGVYLPLAGAKGYGLALVVDVLTAALAGGPIGRELPGDSRPDGLSAFFLVLDPAAFGPADEFAAAVMRLAEQAHATAPLDPGAPVRLPGERAWAERGRRLAGGIPFDGWHWRRMEQALDDLGVARP